MNHYAIQRERSSGFVIGTRERSRFLHGIAKAILVLNLLDGIFTLIWVEFYGAGELNVLMRDLVLGSPLLFMIVKLTVVSFGTLFLWRYRSTPLAVTSLLLAFFSYYLVLLFHLQYASTVFF